MCRVAWLIFLCVSGLPLFTAAQQVTLSAVKISVGNINASLLFYSKCLLFKKIADDKNLANGKSYRQVKLLAGRQLIYLIERGDTFNNPAPIPPFIKSSCSQAIIIELPSLSKIQNNLRKKNVPFYAGSPPFLHEYFNDVSSAFYFSDIDNNLIIITAASPLVSPSKKNNEVAGVVLCTRNIDNSRYFYRQLLGLQINVHKEDDTALNNNYHNTLILIQPKLSAQAGQLSNTNVQLGLLTANADSAYKNLLCNNRSYILSTVSTRQKAGYLIKSFWLRDPDGNTIEIRQVNYDNLPGYICY